MQSNVIVVAIVIDVIVSAVIVKLKLELDKVPFSY